MSEHLPSDAQISEEVSRLAAASHFGELSGADATRLNYLLETSDLARRVFLRAAQETHDLRQWATEYPLRSAVDAGKDAMRSGWIAQRANQFREAWAKPGIAFRHCLAASLLLIVGVVGYYWRPGRLDDSLGQENVVAHVQSAHDCVWFGPFERLAPGKELRAGDVLQLAQGRAKLSFAAGAVVVIESPASIELISATSMRLDHGTVAVRADGPVKDFVVISPDALIVDLGTSFGVHYQAGHPTEVAVFEGAVEIRDSVEADDARVLGLGTSALVRRGAGKPSVDVIASDNLRFNEVLDLLWDDLARDGSGGEGSTITADFNDGPVPGAVDTFYGATRGRGWRTPWMAAGNPLGEIRYEDSLSGDGDPYLSMKFRRAIGRMVAREYGARSDFDPMQPHVITWKWRYDGDPENFGHHFRDRVLFFGCKKFRTNTDGDNSWIIRLAADDEKGGRFRAAYPMHWCVFDGGDEPHEDPGFGRHNLVDTGLEFKPGVVYRFAVAIYPEEARYDVAIRDDERTSVHTNLKFRNRRAEPASVIHFGTRSDDEMADLSFSFDSVRIEQLKEGELLPEIP